MGHIIPTCQEYGISTIEVFVLFHKEDNTEKDVKGSMNSDLCKVLVIDDDEDILNWFRMLEKQDGPYRFTFMQDELEILRAIVQLKPDLIFLDICLTHIDGKKLSEIIRIASTYEIPIVQMSTRETYSTGVPENLFMRKPLERKAVDAKIRTLLKI